MTWPGSGLDACEVTLASPSGNLIVLSTSDLGCDDERADADGDHGQRGER